jgi:hypothetical protein
LMNQKSSDAQTPESVRQALTSDNQHIDLPQLRDDLFRLVLLLRHSFVLHLAPVTAGRNLPRSAV